MQAKREALKKGLLSLCNKGCKNAFAGPKYAQHCRFGRYFPQFDKHPKYTFLI